MNYKLLFPTYRQRYLFVQEALARMGRVPIVLNLGTGEGDYDPMIASHADQLVSCDINRADVDYARALNRDCPNIEYRVEDAQRLSFPDASFDLVVSTDVIEHVPDSSALVAEVARVLRPGGRALITFPSRRFPGIYDPINRLLASRGTHLSVGAYGYNHFKLILDTEFEEWLQINNLQVEQKFFLSSHLVGALEMYWPALLQKLLKANAANEDRVRSGPKLRPTIEPPALVGLTDTLIRLDRRFCRHSTRSVGVGYQLAK